MLLAAGCGVDDPKAGGDIGAASIAITSVPAGVGCIRITAIGARSVDDTFPVMPGASSILQMRGLPTGDVVFHGAAFDGACDALGPGTSPSWIGDPVSAKVAAGQIVRVTIVLVPNSRGIVSVDFRTDPDTGGPCVGNEKGCLSPDDAYGKAGEPAPDGARMVSPAEFGGFLVAGTHSLTSPRIEQAAVSREADRAKQNLELVKSLLAKRPDLLARALQPITEDAKTQRLDDGTIELTLEGGRDTASTNVQQKVLAYDERFRHSEIAHSLVNFGTQENQLGIYSLYFAELPDEYKKMRQLPDPKEMSKAPAETLYNLNASLAKDLAIISGFINFLDLPPAGYPATCGAEEGTPATPGDQTGGSCTPANLFAKHKFPLKWRATCVKNQGHRGTCVSFGITGAVEAAIAQKHNRWTNLSEERLYYWAKVPTAYGDGLSTGGTIGDMDSTLFTYPWEYQWDYNPSYSRTASGGVYSSSCVGYSGEHCSNTAHQGDLVCFDFLGLRFCAWDGSAPPSSGFRLIASAKNFFDWGDAAALGWAQLALALKIPLVMALDVTPSFDGAAANGIATYTSASETSRGGHAVSIMGYVTNGSLPAGTPPGAGGGYFIVKNSWGKCWKDGGYIYLPFEWVATYAYGIWSAGVN